MTIEIVEYREEPGSLECKIGILANGALLVKKEGSKVFADLFVLPSNEVDRRKITILGSMNWTDELDKALDNFFYSHGWLMQSIEMVVKKAVEAKKIRIPN